MISREPQATVGVAGQGAGQMSLVAQTPQAGELMRAIIGGEDPRSKTLFRILNETIQPNVYKAYSLLVEFPIKQEFEGTCTFAL